MRDPSSNWSVTTLLAAPGGSRSVDNIQRSAWSVVWSASTVPVIDAGRGRGRTITRRFDLRISALLLAGCLALTPRPAAATLACGGLPFLVFLVIFVVLIGNAMRHFEIYLGEWTVGGPGCAFRMVPIFDGIGIAMCLLSLMRATLSSAVAAIALLYVLHAINDQPLPFMQCSDKHQLQTLRLEMAKQWNALLCKPDTAVCEGVLTESLPTMLPTPSFNFFYLDLMYIHQNLGYGGLNAKMLYAVLGIWTLVLLSLLVERLKWNQIVWNNAYTWMVASVAVWSLVVLAMAVYSVDSFADVLTNIHSFLHLKSLVAAASALELALYTHACGFGSEILLGKGLNYYADGHSDSQLAKETILCSSWSISLCIVNGLSVLLCSNKEAVHPLFAAGKMFGTTSRNLWIFPLYAACVPSGNYTHILTLFIFGGLMFMHVILSIYFVKTCIHCIFEYRAKLIMFELLVVVGTCVVCCLLTLPYALRGGSFLLESMNDLLTGLTSTAICMLELVALFYLYNNRDFITDVLKANASNKCPTRVFMLWKALPSFIAIALLLKIPGVLISKQPLLYSIVAAVAMLVILLSVPIKGIANSIMFYRRQRAE